LYARVFRGHCGLRSWSPIEQKSIKGY
jgi:hypothetical protein